MNEEMAWNKFEEDGSISSYLNYVKIRRQNKNYDEEIGKIEGDSIEVNKGKGNSNKGSTI